MAARSIVQKAIDRGEGVFRLAPAWVPRSFCRPGRRLKLHPDDYYALGLKRGGIDERWFSSTTFADNGPGTPEDEGLSYLWADDGNGEKALLRDAVDLLGRELLGDAIMDRFGRLPMYSKFFDNMGPLPHHIHHDDRYAARVGAYGKPEMYFFPAQVNNHGGEFPFTFFGFNPATSRAQVKEALMNFTKGDNHITDLSRAYRLTVDTGWNVPPGVLHAPGSLCTYEPQFASDVFAMYQSVLFGGQAVDEELLWKNCPEEELGNFDYLMEIIDWNLNVADDLQQAFFMAPKPAGDAAAMEAEGYLLEWICYKCPIIGAQRLTVKPGRSVTLRQEVPYGVILVQGHGRFGSHAAETPAMIRFGEATRDEFFVTEPAARRGVVVKNESPCEDLVLLLHFALHPELPLV